MDLRPNCIKCKCALDMANIRALPDGKGFICKSCLGVTNGKYEDSHESKGETELFSKKKYLCEDCGYTFERSATFIVKNCPMCATQRVYEVVTDEEELLLE
jgi:hypothetical protein